MSRSTSVYRPPRARWGDDTSSVDSGGSSRSNDFDWTAKRTQRGTKLPGMKALAKKVEKSSSPVPVPPISSGPSVPSVPRKDLAARLTKLYKPAEVHQSEAKVTRPESSQVVIKTPSTMSDRYVSDGYLRLPKGNTTTMVVFPSHQAAKEILKAMYNENYLLGLLLFDLPVVITSYDSIVPHISDYHHKKVEWGDESIVADNETCMVVSITSDYKLPVLIEDNYDAWYKAFDRAYTDIEGLAGLLDIDVNASEWLRTGKMTFKEEPTEAEWEAFRIIFYAIRKRDPQHPIWFPVTIHKTPQILDLSFLGDKEPYNHPWSG